MRRVVRVALSGVILLQVAALAVFAIPESRAWAVAVTNFHQIQGAGGTLSGIIRAVDRVRNEVQDVEAINDDIRAYEEQHSQATGAVNTFSVAEVSQTPVQNAFNAHRPTPQGGLLGQQQQTGHLGYTDQQAVQNMATIMPGALPWTNYHAEYVRSGDATVMSLRAAVAALHEFNQNMQQDQQRMNDLLSEARGSDSRLAVGQLQVEGQMELARQIQALRAQQALQTNIYAITESHNVGSDLRNVARDKQTSCQIMAMLGGGIVGGIVGDVGAAAASGFLCN